MSNSVQINFKGELVTVEELPRSAGNEKRFVVHLPKGAFILCVKEDTEGAGRWIDEMANHGTAESGEIGALIETALSGQQNSL
ncbi:MAG: hypothetical protein J0I41_05985 [Filimonas sp.]|nr:hypothetical protein [Filimonas sp.]